MSGIKFIGKDPNGLAKAIKTDDKGNIGVRLDDNASYESTHIDKRILACRVSSNKLYATDELRQNLYFSTDNGENWVQVWTAPITILAAHMTINNTILIFTTDKNVYRSTDNQTFTSVLQNARPPFGSRGVDSNGSVVVFAEYYDTVAGNEVKIYRSTNDGATWAVSMTLQHPDIHHFHSCQYLHEISSWIVTTGDNNIRWYQSYDGVSNWKIILETADQKFRTLGVQNDGSDYFIWGSDGTFSGGNGGVYKVNYNNKTFQVTGNPQKMLSLPVASYATYGKTPVIIATTMVNDYRNVENKSYIYVSLDGGKSWEVISAYEIFDTSGGFFDICGPDKLGNYYLYGTAISATNYYTTVILKPTYDSSKQIMGYTNDKSTEKVCEWKLKVGDVGYKTFNINLTKYSEILVVAKNSFDQDVRVDVDLTANYRPKKWDATTSAWVDDRSVTLPKSGDLFGYLLNTRWGWLEKCCFESLQFGANITIAPTVGEFILTIYGTL